MSVQLRVQTVTRSGVSPSSGDPRDWRLEAACRDMGTDLFFHPEGESGERRAARTRLAQAVCARCPVTHECEAFATRTRSRDGVWAGRDRSERGPSGNLQSPPWTPEEDAIAGDRSLSIAEVARRTGRSQWAARARRARVYARAAA